MATETKKIPYEFNLTCGHEALVEVDAQTHNPISLETGEPDVAIQDGITYVTYTCPECGAEETTRC